MIDRQTDTQSETYQIANRHSIRNIANIIVRRSQRAVRRGAVGEERKRTAWPLARIVGVESTLHETKRSESATAITVHHNTTTTTTTTTTTYDDVGQVLLLLPLVAQHRQRPAAQIDANGSHAGLRLHTSSASDYERTTSIDQSTIDQLSTHTQHPLSRTTNQRSVVNILSLPHAHSARVHRRCRRSRRSRGRCAPTVACLTICIKRHQCTRKYVGDVKRQQYTHAYGAHSHVNSTHTQMYMGEGECRVCETTSTSSPTNRLTITHRRSRHHEWSHHYSPTIIAHDRGTARCALHAAVVRVARGIEQQQQQQCWCRCWCWCRQRRGCVALAACWAAAADDARGETFDDNLDVDPTHTCDDGDW